MRDQRCKIVKLYQAPAGYDTFFDSHGAYLDGVEITKGNFSQCAHALFDALRKERELIAWALEYVYFCERTERTCSVTDVDVINVLFGKSKFTEEQTYEINRHRNVCEDQTCRLAAQAISYVSFCEHAKLPCTVTYSDIQDVLEGTKHFTSEQLNAIEWHQVECEDKARHFEEAYKEGCE